MCCDHRRAQPTLSIGGHGHAHGVCGCLGQEKLSHRMLQAVMPHPQGCIFASAQEHTRGAGHCLTHIRECKLKTTCDLMSAGLPCHPFSFMRYKGGKTQDSSAVQEHSEYRLVMEDFPAAVASRKPGAANIPFFMCYYMFM